jgi:hypothetical protein
MSSLQGRFASKERHLWWDIDTYSAEYTGCALPCEYKVIEAERVVGEYEELKDFKEYPADSKFGLQVLMTFDTSVLFRSISSYIVRFLPALFCGGCDHGYRGILGVRRVQPGGRNGWRLGTLFGLVLLEHPAGLIRLSHRALR